MIINSNHNPILKQSFVPPVSHTTDDLVFEWDETVPLYVSDNIQLPQLQLVDNYTNDCTQVYSTGKIYLCSNYL